MESTSRPMEFRLPGVQYRIFLDSDDQNVTDQSIQIETGELSRLKGVYTCQGIEEGSTLKSAKSDPTEIALLCKLYIRFLTMSWMLLQNCYCWTRYSVTLSTFWFIN